MDGGKVGVFEEGDEVGLGGLLEGHDGRGLEAEIGLCGRSEYKGKGTQPVITYLEVLSDLTNKTLEGELADEELGGLLVATNLAEGDGTGAEAVRLLHTTSRSCCGRGLAGRLGSELLTGRLACRAQVKLTVVADDEMS